MKFTTATFATAMYNIVPAITFVMAWIFRLEIVKLKSLHSQGKIIGTLVTIGGAMIMTLIRGPAIQFPWTNQHNLHHQTSVNSVSTHDQIKGSLMITSGCFSWAGFVIVQVSFTIKIQVKYTHLQSKYVNHIWNTAIKVVRYINFYVKSSHENIF
ncbi:hypothetical protein HanXRQr2_Chr08g0332551 [Helianthus annuus]|uniref:WAT1-related protein n=1 Tax=Helianthus annuus TaxID=4232 RepID=A0A9K3IE35_HELAN|nr:hypothetical protein HanXRQr2_Chr08g0332551 [Helianthus annuus]KAJ0718740.1 hypothetical protein HanLR1_Chr08g0273931 [Helianthus annuus]